VCREKQLDDPIIIFKLKVEDELRKKYKDAIQSLEDQVNMLMPDLVPINEYLTGIPLPPSEYLIV